MQIDSAPDRGTTIVIELPAEAGGGMNGSTLRSPEGVSTVAAWAEAGSAATARSDESSPQSSLDASS
jgi:hypothetical protein